MQETPFQRHKFQKNFLGCMSRSPYTVLSSLLTFDFRLGLRNFQSSKENIASIYIVCQTRLLIGPIQTSELDRWEINLAEAIWMWTLECELISIYKRVWTLFSKQNPRSIWHGLCEWPPSGHWCSRRSWLQFKIAAISCTQLSGKFYILINTE